MRKNFSENFYSHPLLLKKKLQGGSLIATLILTLILFITCSILLLAVYYSRYFETTDHIDERLRDDLRSATTLILSKKDPLQTFTADSLLFFEHQPDYLRYTREWWGLFPCASVRVSYKGRYKKRQFLYGASNHTYSAATLYLADHDRPLSVVGDTYIEGRAYLPKSGIRSGFFGQKGFSVKQLIAGEKDSSAKTLPALNPELLRYLKTLVTIDKDARFTELLNDTSTQSFEDGVRYIKMNARGLLSNQKLQGKLVIVSDSVLEADATTKIRDAILVAPFIHFKSGFTGNVQAFALDSITIDEGCHLQYPSCAVGMGRNELLGSTGATVTLHDGATLDGIAMALAGDKTSNIKPVIKIKKAAAVNGLVYNEGYTYLNGKVKGAVFTDFFFEQRGPVTMENMLIDASITQSKWHSWSGYFSMFSGSTRKTIIRWLY